MVHLSRRNLLTSAVATGAVTALAGGAAPAAQAQPMTGSEETKKYFLYTEDGRRDNTHFNTPGGAAIARMVAAGLLSTSVVEPGHVRRLDEDIPSSWFTWPENALDSEPTL